MKCASKELGRRSDGDLLTNKNNQGAAHLLPAGRMPRLSVLSNLHNKDGTQSPFTIEKT